MKTWIITDTHFNDDKLCYLCGRPKNCAQRINDSIHELVNDEDTLIHLGDICMGGDQLIHDNIVWQWPGKRKILVRGNHDKKSLSWYMDHGWTYACDQLGMTVYGKRVLLSHKPMDATEWDLNIFGHFHNSSRRRGDINGVVRGTKNILVALEWTGYKPIMLRTLVVCGAPIGKTQNSEMNKNDNTN